MIEVPPSAVPRSLRVYGFIVNCTDVSSSGAPTAFLFNIMIDVPFRFAESYAEGDDRCAFADSYCWVRTLSFSSMMRYDTPVSSSRMGDPVCGVLESTTDPEKPVEHPNSMLAGRAVATFRESQFKIRASELYSVLFSNSHKRGARLFLKHFW